MIPLITLGGIASGVARRVPERRPVTFTDALGGGQPHYLLDVMGLTDTVSLCQVLTSMRL